MKHRLLYILPLLLFTLQAYAQIYTYDANNKLTKVEYGNGVTVSYEYDVLGNRTSKTVSGVTAQSFKVTVKASPKEYGSVDGGGTYSEGANVELNAVASVGFEFEKWSDGPTDNPRTITVTKDVSYTALFKVKEKNQEESGGEIGPGGVDLGIYDTNGDGVVNQYDLDAIIDAYLEDAPATPSTDLDDDGEITIADISMMVAIMNDMHTGEYNGHEYVDLGLPSGTLWATCNLGATSSEESGCYYAWGETTGSCEGKTDFSWRNYKYCNGLIGEGLTKYNNDPELGYEGYTDDLETLEPSDDAATANWGGKWRMPTRQDINELRNKQYTKWTFATHNGVKGFVVTSIVKGYVGNSIFLPAEGGFYDGSSLDYKGEYSYYWASTAFLNSYGDYAKSIVLRASGTHGDGFRYRCEGLSIRPVVNLGEIATGSDPDLSNGLVAYYPFNGNANDESGHGNHGTPMSSVTLTTGVNGDANSAYKFGGCDNPGNIHIPNSESLIIDDSWSFATFVKPTSYTGMDGWGRKSTTDGMHAIMGKDHDQSGFSIQYRLNSDSLHVWLGCTSGWTKDFGASIYGNYLNQWVHVSITYSNSTFKVYLNGQKRAEAKIQANFSVANTKDLYLGKYRDSWYPMDGVLDEVRIYNRALSDAEIKQLAGEVNLNSPVAEAIDLGLPSGTKWASWNIGASSPEDCGGYYAWGETEEKDYYDWSTYTHCDGTLETCHHIGDNIAGTEYDVARMKWGESWTMPSTDQIKELMDNCERTWTSQNGTNGMLFTGPNGNSIFLPAAGWRTYDDLIAKRENGDYWSSELNMHHEYCADGMGFDDVNSLGWTDSKLFHGRSVRAVCSPEKPNDECPVAEAIDLGLPSGTKWASWNVGASAPEEYGGYYAWGETEEKDVYDWSTYIHCDGSRETCHHIGDDIAGTEYDVAHVKWGGSWCIPSRDQIEELCKKCSWSWGTQNGVNGMLVTGPNGNTIFLPAAGYHDYRYQKGDFGYYWLSSPFPDCFARFFEFSSESSYIHWVGAIGRPNGLPVRAVQSSEPPIAEAVDLGLSSGTKWASWNIGASAPEDHGHYYAWGETEKKLSYEWSTYIHSDGTEETIHYIGSDIAGTEYDVAHAKWGGLWRMPSYEQIEELFKECSWSWGTQNGVNGMLVTGPNGAAIFLPAAGYRSNVYIGQEGEYGYYWSSSDPNYENYTLGFGFFSDSYSSYLFQRCLGLPVRAVISP